MWYLVVNQKSERYFIKTKVVDIVYLVKESTDRVEEKSIEELRGSGFIIVGECFSSEIEKLDKLIVID